MAFLRAPDGSWRLECAKSESELAEFAAHWKMRRSTALAALALGVRVRECLGFYLWIISAGRTCEQQQDLEAAGRPAASCNISTHVIDSPARLATGFDIRGPVFDEPIIWHSIGTIAQALALRWGGGSRILSNGLPEDLNHFDEGPRSVTG